jgi:sporulation protein YlmC with PRC-barrel domain
MAIAYRYYHCLLTSLVVLICAHGFAVAGETNQEKKGEDSSIGWQENAVEYAHIMSRVKWTPVAGGMPKRGGYFEEGAEYTGVPYSSVKSVGRYIGFDIFLKTFLAAVQNPHSVLYTENLYGKVSNAECYYGKVCSSYTSYALQCGIWYLSRLHGPPYRNGVTLVEPQSALFAEVGDVIFTPPTTGGSHIELVTGITRGGDGKVTHVRVEESRPQTTKDTNRDVANFNSHLGSRGRRLYRITDLDAWREGNRADSFLFPNYEEDSAIPTINRVLLLDRGDWVPYHKGQDVKFNVMDRDAQGVKALVIKRGDRVVEKIDRPGKGVIERSFASCGDYTAHCVMNDDSLSQVCEFSVCDLDFSMLGEGIALGESWEIDISSENMNIIILYFRGCRYSYIQHNVFVSEQERQDGKVVIPADMIQDKGKMNVWLIGENRYGRLKKRLDFVVKE